MRHRKHTGKLNRTTAERTALLRGLASALLIRQRIVTTLAKAKEGRKLAEKLITLGKKADLSSQRMIFSYVRDRSIVKEIVHEIAPRFKNRQGGYTRIIKLPNRRKGDNAELVILELTEQKVIAPPPVKKGKKKEKEETTEKKIEKIEKTPEGEAPKEKPVHKEELPKHPSKKEEKRRHIEKPKKGGFFQGIQRFLKPKNTGG